MKSWNMSAVLVLVACVLVGWASVQAQEALVLFVHGGDSMGGGDSTLVAHMEAQGIEVTTIPASQVTPDDAGQVDLVIVMESISSGDVADKFKDATTPVLATEAYVYDDMQLCSEWTNTGSGFYQVDILDPEHPLSAGLSGTVDVYTDLNGNIATGVPSDGAVKVATPAGDPAKFAIFAYELGATLVDGSAAAERRVGFFIWGQLGSALTEDGWKLWDAAVYWAMYMDPPANAVNDATPAAPTAFELSQNYPNPFNPSTTIEFSLQSAENVRLSVYDILGQEVARLVDGHRSAGTYSVEFDASDLTSGVYIYKLETGQQSITRKMNLLR